MYNALIESTLPDLHFVFLHWQVWVIREDVMTKKHENLMIFQRFQQSDSPYLFYVICLWNHKLVNVCWPSRSRWRSNRNLLTVACNCSILVKRFRFYRNLLLFFEFRYYPYYYYYSFFSGHAIIIPNLQNRITFSHQTPLIHGPLSDTLQRAFWCWSGLPFWI